VQLVELAAEPDLESLADGLTTWKHAFAFVLRRAIRECDAQADPCALERAVYRAYFGWSLAQLREDDENQAMVRESIQRHIDLVNVLAILAIVRDREGDEAENAETFGRGSLGEKLLRELVASDSLEASFETLDGTYLAPGIEKGILAFGQTQSLAVMERYLEAVIVERACRRFREDMLGMAVPLGFVWRKYNEVANLRMLARGAMYRMPPNAMREGLLLV